MHISKMFIVDIKEQSTKKKKNEGMIRKKRVKIFAIINHWILLQIVIKWKHKMCTSLSTVNIEEIN